MYTIPPKKLLIINILDILKKYSDEEHRLSQKDIEEILLKEYSMKADRKSIKRNLMDLIDFGYQLGYTEIERTGKNGDATILTDWYLERDFTDAELRLLIDSILLSKSIPTSQCKALIEKLKSLSNNYFDVRVKHVRSIPEIKPGNQQLFYTIEILDEAIEKKKKVRFSLSFYGFDKKRHISTHEDGTPKVRTFNPYQMVTANGRYYLLGNFEYHDDVAYVRLDHIVDIEILPEPVKPKTKVKGLEKGLDLPKHMAEHVYMSYGDTADITLRVLKQMSDQIVDWFGFDFTVIEEEEDAVIIKLRSSIRAMRFWAMQYGIFVEILEPKELREEIKKTVETIYGRHHLSKILIRYYWQ